MKFVFCLIVSVVFIRCAEFSSFGGGITYEVIPEYFDFPLGAKDKLLDIGTVRPKKFNRTTYVVDGEFEILRPLSDDLLWHFSIHLLQGNEYRQYSMRQGDGICTASIKYKSILKDAFEHTNFPWEYTCPVLPGKFWIKDMAFQNQMLVAQLPNGNKFRLNYTFFDGDEIISTFALYLTINRNSFI